MTLTYPDGATVDLSIEDEEEEGWVETEEVVLDWCHKYDPHGITATELASASGLTPEQAKARLVNLWENEFLRVDGGVHDGRFFLVSAENAPTEPQ